MKLKIYGVVLLCETLQMQMCGCIVNLDEKVEVHDGFGRFTQILKRVSSSINMLIILCSMCACLIRAHYQLTNYAPS